MAERTKAKLIAQELISYYIMHQILIFDLHISIHEDRSIVNIEGYRSEFLPPCEEISERLMSRRKPELEDYYEQLLGARDDEDELDLLAHIIDKAEVLCDEDTIKIEVMRKFY